MIVQLHRWIVLQLYRGCQVLGGVPDGGQDIRALDAAERGQEGGGTKQTLLSGGGLRDTWRLQESAGLELSTGLREILQYRS